MVRAVVLFLVVGLLGPAIPTGADHGVCPPETTHFSFSFSGTGSDVVGFSLWTLPFVVVGSQPDDIDGVSDITETVHMGHSEDPFDPCFQELAEIKWTGSYTVRLAVGGFYTCTFESDELYDRQDPTPDAPPLAQTYSSSGVGAFTVVSNARSCGIDLNAYFQEATAATTAWIGDGKVALLSCNFQSDSIDCPPPLPPDLGLDCNLDDPLLCVPETPLRLGFAGSFSLTSQPLL